MTLQSLEPEDIKNKDIDVIFNKLETNDKGLTTQEAAKRLEFFGLNEITEVKISFWRKFLENFWGPIPWMIEIAAVLSILIRHWEDFAIILFMLFINAFVRFWEESKAENAVELLKQNLALKAKVLRDGKWKGITASELVPGDITRVRLGDIVPADIKLIEGEYLTLDESMLTGESLPVNKKKMDLAYEGTIVRKGEMNGIVVGTGVNTFFGKTTSLVSEAKNTSHFQQAIIKIGNYLIILAISLVLIVFAVGLYRHEKFIELLQFALVLVIAAIPVALPAVLMVSMAVGAADLAKKKAIAKRLLAIEELASMDILCSDKTGTITKNEISIGEIISYGEFTETDAIICGALASREEDNDPIDNAFFIKLKEQDRNLSSYKINNFIPFDPVIKRTEVTVQKDGNQHKISKGAIQAILALLPEHEKIEQDIQKQESKLASEGFRILGIAKTDDKDKWNFVGIVALFDLPREDSAETISVAISMGIDVKMITGDHTAIAKEIASKLGLGDNFVSASTFSSLDETEIGKVAEKANGFADVYPEHKYKIVDNLQLLDHVVGMTGDGVNDAPALKKADVGIAVSNATDAAKSAADIVLTEPGLSVIIDATNESRIIFERMKSYATYRIAETIRVLIFLVFIILTFNFYPITAIMIVILALLNDLPIMTIAFDNANPSQYPVRWKMRKVLIVATVLGIAGVIFSSLLFLIGKYVFDLESAKLQSFIFLKLAVGGHMTIYLTRSEGNHFWQKPYPAKILLIACESTQIVATLFAISGILIPGIGLNLGLFVWAYAILAFIITNFIKVAVVRHLNKNEIVA